MFDMGVQFVLAFNLELQYASKRLRNHGASGGEPRTRRCQRIVRRQEVLMELVFENGWNGNRGLFDKLAGFQRDMDEAAGSPMAPRADVIEDKDAYPRVQAGQGPCQLG
jgi:hypothetical protein